VSRPPRIPGFPYVGAYRYFLTFCTYHRVPAFRDPVAVWRTVAQFRHAAKLHRFAVLAYCFMPDHVHLLVGGVHAESNLRCFAKAAKQHSGAAHAMAAGTPLWQEGYHDRVLREADDARQVGRYILENPVRAGLVTHAGEYPYLGSDVWSVRELLESV
jgi:putative transposase